MKDSFYTSTSLAERLVSFVEKRSFTSVVDFCVGDGQLLKAAESVWKDIKCYGCDISRKAINKLRVNHPNWIVGKTDFTNINSRRNCKITYNKTYDLILLNPPFTCKGSSINKITFEGKTYYVSTAMMFVVEALKYIHKNSVLLAILPISCAYSKKDELIWKLLVNKYNLRILEERDKQSFKNCNPNIVLISINDFTNREKNTKQISKLCLNQNNVELFRGNLSVYRSNNYTGANQYPFLHTTNLINNIICNITKCVDYPNSLLTGPAVLISRVGNPSIQKICCIGENEKYVLSDCIIAIKTTDYNEAEKLQKLLIDDWKYFKTLYKGTAARYITLERLRLYLGIL